jgi:nitroreductase
LSRAKTMTNPVIDLLLSRRSVLAKDLIEPGPTDTDLDTIIAAGLRVPDHGRVEPWRIQVLRKPAQGALAARCAEIFDRENPDASEVLIAAERERMQRSPLLLVVTSKLDPTRFAKVPAIEQVLSAGAVCQNILIAAQALGYGAQWVTGWPAYHPDVRIALGHDPDTEVVGFIHLGTAASPPNERPRPSADDIVSEWQP